VKNKLGIISGFVIGIIFGFFIVIVLSKMHPEEDLAGVVIFICLVSGLLFSFIGYFIESYFVRNKKVKV
jgi:CDP-diglyceride synthetase